MDKMPDQILKKHSASQQALLEQILQEGHVPTLPAVAQKLIELCQDERANFNAFAQVIEADPGLASRLLQVANSAYYGLRHKATSLERAIQALGLEYVKAITLGFHLADTLNKLNGNGFSMKEFWRQSLLRGVIARQIAAGYLPDRLEEAFLIGLLEDCGIPLLVEAMGERYAQLWRDCRCSHTALLKWERNLFDLDHVAAVGTIVEQWSLPELLAEPIRMHHRRTCTQPSGNQQVQLCQIAYFVGALSLDSPESFTEEDLKLADYGRVVFGLDSEKFSKILERSREEFLGIAQLFGDILPENINVTSLLAQAKKLLGGLAIEAHGKISDLEVEIARLGDSCRILGESLEDCLRDAETDSLTGLVGRGLLERYLEMTCDLVQKGQGELTIFFTDIDNFKNINTLYGHAAGDQVLKDLADLFRSFFRGSCCLARYGGDEIVAVLFGRQLKQAITLATGLLRKIRQIEIPHMNPNKTKDMQPSCSIGILFCESGSRPGGAARVLELADNQMYQAKNSGKDSFSFQVLLAETQDVRHD